MAGKLDGQLAVITGASAGIGEAIALALAAEGAHLVLGARRRERLEELQKKVLSIDPAIEVTVTALDVTDPASCTAFAETASRAGLPSILVNNAGLARGVEKVAEASEGAWREMIDTNVLGLLRLTRAFLPGMIQRGRGTIINLGSVAANEPYAGGAVYGGTKAMVAVISKSLRHELLGTGVRVSTVEPAAVETEFSEVRFRGDKGKAKQVYKGIEPLVAQDVAEVVTFIATRPAHVVLETVTMYPVQQASTTAFFRKE